MEESMQKKLGRVRPPRVQITYDVETGGAIEKKELPFIVGILSNLSGMSKEPLPPIKERKFVEIDRDNFDDVMAANKPECFLKVKNVLSDEAADMNVGLNFIKFEDFEPINIIKQVEPINALYVSRSHLRDMLGKLDGNDPLDAVFDEILGSADVQTELKGAFEGTEGAEAWKSVEPTETMQKLMTDGGMVLDETQKEYALQLIGEFVVSILGDLPADNQKNVGDLLNDKIMEIDNRLSNQLNLIMHENEFQKIEATWRGLNYLVFKTETGTMLKLRVMNVSKEDLLKDMQKALEFDQSGLFKLVYEAEYGTYGGFPYSLLVGDYEFGRHPNDLELLGKLSGVASSAHAPFISAAYAKLFDMEDFFTLAKPRDLSKIFESNELIKWRSFRESEDSRYVNLSLPRVLIRLPYGKDTNPAEGFDFTEDTDGKNASKYLWGNASYVLAERITNAFALYSWTAAIRGVEGGGLVEGLPVHTFKTDEGDIALTCPTQVSITDRREKELNDLGFMAICHCKGTDKAAFFGGQTTNLPKKYMTDEANANARISAMLPYILASSRFAHYIKAIMREKIGSFFTRGNVEDFLNEWIANYILLDDSASQDAKAKFPLRDARVAVTDIPGKPGAYKATVFLRPHFQLEELTTSIRLVAEIPA